MSKVLRIQKGGYKIIAEQGSEIRFDPGTGGRVTVTGDLYVEGQTTYINTTDLEIEDRIVILNKGEQGPGSGQSSITGAEPMSGLRIDRGNVDALMVFDEIPYTGLVTDSTELTFMGPSFVFKDTTPSKNLLPLTTNRIQTYGLANNANQHLTLYTGYEGVVKVEVQLTDPNSEQDRLQYHERIFERNDQGLADNDIPNLRFIKEYVRASAGEAVIQRFYRYTDDNDNTYSGALAKDITQEDDGFSGVLFTVGSGPFPRLEPTEGVASIGRFGTENGMIVGTGGFNDNNIRIIIDQSDNAIIGTDNCDLIINPETGRVILKNVLHIENLGNEFPDPSAVVGENVIFSRQIQGSGGTGLYFTNTGTTGELCSAANALVYGLIF